MKVKITEEKLYPIFKKFMEIYFKNYEWRKDRLGNNWFIDPEGHGHMVLFNTSLLRIYHDIRENILRYIPMEESMLMSLMGKWVGETFKFKRIETIEWSRQGGIQYES